MSSWLTCLARTLGRAQGAALHGTPSGLMARSAVVAGAVIKLEFTDVAVRWTPGVQAVPMCLHVRRLTATIAATELTCFKKAQGESSIAHLPFSPHEAAHLQDMVNKVFSMTCVKICGGSCRCSAIPGKPDR